jgi:hypothetical protein
MKTNESFFAMKVNEDLKLQIRYTMPLFLKVKGTR